MDRKDLIPSILTSLGISVHEQQKGCHRQFIKPDEFLYYSLVPVLLTVTALAFLKRRRWKRLDLCNGRPGIPWPVNFLEEQDDRLPYVAAFGLISWSAWDALTGDIPFEWSKGNRFIRNFARISACLMSALVCYPIFGSIASDNMIGYALGSIYIWMYSIIYLLSNYPCTESGVTVVFIDMLQLVPAIICMIYLCIQLPWRCWKRGVKHWRLILDHQSEDLNWAENMKSSKPYEYVRLLLAANRSEGIIKRKRVLDIASRKFYRNIPGFRFSLSILVGVVVSIQFVYVGTLDAVKAYRDIIANLRSPFSNVRVNSSSSAIPRFFANQYLHSVGITQNDLTKQEVEVKDEYIAWVNAFEASCYISVVLAFISTAAAVLFTLRNYRRHVLLLYRGHRLPILPRMERDSTPTSIMTNGAKYVGFQFGYAIWGFVYQAALLLVVCFGVSAVILAIVRHNQLHPIVSWIFNVIGPIFIYVVALLIVQRVLVRFCFLQRNEQGRLVLAFNNRRLLWNFQYFMVFANSTIGLVSCFIRIFKTVVLGAWTLPRLDVSMLNRHFERFDNGYAAYCGLLAMECCHTNPVLVTFTKLLWLERYNHYKNQIRSRDEQSETNNDEQQCTKSTRWKTIRNRWHLYVTLYHNPGLRLLRKQNILIDRLMHAEDVVLDDVIIEAPRLRLLLRRLSDRKDWTSV